MTTMKSKKRSITAYGRDRARREKKIAPLTRIVPGDLVCIANVPWCAENEGGVRMWDVDSHEFVYAPVSSPALLLSVSRPVTEFTAPGKDSHWTTILHAERRLEALSDELEASPI